MSRQNKNKIKTKMYVNSLQLIKEIKKHEILYNKECKGFHRMKKHEAVWDQIHQALFPNFDIVNPQLQRMIRISVNKRWKTIRDSLVRALRKKHSDPHKLDTPQMKALAFMIPHMTHGGFDFDPTSVNYNEETESDDRSYDKSSMDHPSAEFMSCEGTSFEQVSDDYGDSINKYESGTVNTESEDDVLSIKSEAYEITFDDLPDRTSEANVKKQESYNEFSADENADNEECILVHSDTEDQPTTILVHSDTEDKPTTQLAAPFCQPPVDSGISHCGHNDVHLNLNVFDLLKKATMDAQDEDRMFLLSVLSDFKRVSPENRVNVKMKIVQAIVEGIPTNSST